MKFGKQVIFCSDNYIIYQTMNRQIQVLLSTGSILKSFDQVVGKEKEFVCFSSLFLFKTIYASSTGLQTQSTAPKILDLLTVAVCIVTFALSL